MAASEETAVAMGVAVAMVAEAVAAVAASGLRQDWRHPLRSCST